MGHDKHWFVIDLHYVQPLEAIDAAMKEHVAFLARQRQAGRFLAWGRKVPRTGGIILACGDDLEQIAQAMQEDPFLQRELATLKITEFSPKPEGVVQAVMIQLAGE